MRPNPFSGKKSAAFEKSGKDKEFKGKGKEGSKREEKFDRAQMMKGGGKVGGKKC